MARKFEFLFNDKKIKNVYNNDIKDSGSMLVYMYCRENAKVICGKGDIFSFYLT